MLQNLPSLTDGARLLNVSPADSPRSDLDCYFSQPGNSIFVSFLSINSILLLPLSVLILSHGFREWWGRRSSSSSSSSGASMLSHVDSFTYALAAMELVGVSGCLFVIFGLSYRQVEVIPTGFLLLCACAYAETFFHLLTSVERYVAVVHPVVYRGLRSERGVRFRNASVAAALLLSVAQIGLMTDPSLLAYGTVSIMVLSVFAISFCSVSVLCALNAPGPGDNGAARKKVDPAKKRAFYTILVILMAMLLRFVWSLAWAGHYQQFGVASNCVMLTCEIWFHLPSSLALPLLFLHRKGMLAWLRGAFLAANASQ